MQQADAEAQVEEVVSTVNHFLNSTRTCWSEYETTVAKFEAVVFIRRNRERLRRKSFDEIHIVKLGICSRGQSQDGYGSANHYGRK